MTDLIGSHIEETTLFDERGWSTPAHLRPDPAWLASAYLTSTALAVWSDGHPGPRGDQDMLVHMTYLLLVTGAGVALRRP